MNIRLLEELSLNAWPALHTLVVDGWIVRFANGYTRRANSVNPLYAPEGDVAASILACEALFAVRGLPAVFKLTPASQPPGLDDRLAQRGYERDAETSVQSLALGDAHAQLDPLPPAPSPAEDRRRGRGDSPAPMGAVITAPALTEDWFAAHVALSGLDPRHHLTARAMLGALAPLACFAYTTEEGQPVACGLAVFERGYVGFFDIVTGPAHRRQGHARRLMRDLLAWGQAQGAHTAYLQVMVNNAAALGLYAGLGFAEAYRYWYRIQGN